MKNTLHILIPSDFSRESVYALMAASELACRIETKISMVHVMVVNPVSHIGHQGVLSSSSSHHSQLIKQNVGVAEKQMRSQADRYGVKLHDSSVLFGNISTSIVEYAERLGIDLIIMGAHRQKNIISWFSGSENQFVARISRIPVLSVSHKEALNSIDNILFIHDIYSHPLIAPHSVIMKLALIYEVAITLLYIDNQHLSTEQLNKTIYTYKETHNTHAFDVVIKDWSAPTKVYEDETLAQYSMLCLGTKGRSAFSQFFKQSIAEKMIQKNTSAILTFHIQ